MSITFDHMATEANQPVAGLVHPNFGSGMA
jgi:hypothetical protein